MYRKVNNRLIHVEVVLCSRILSSSRIFFYVNFVQKAESRNCTFQSSIKLWWCRFAIFWSWSDVWIVHQAKFDKWLKIILCTLLLIFGSKCGMNKSSNIYGFCAIFKFYYFSINCVNFWHLLWQEGDLPKWKIEKKATNTSELNTRFVGVVLDQYM